MPRYHVIPHSHWDREWYLSFDHFRVRLVHMIDDLLAILAERDDYAGFLLDGQTVVVDDYLEIRPERRVEIEAYVRGGRLSVGPWYVLPDSFLVSGEALVRNLMRGRATARAFGRSMDVGYIPDSFGHTAQIPQILRGFGIETAIAWRGFGGEPGQEGSEYRWRSPDGSEVLMEHLSELGYSGAYFNDPAPEAVEARFADVRQRLDARAQTPERLVLSGGDHHWPTRDLPDVLAHLDEAAGGDGVRIVHSSLADFMAALQRAADGQALPAVDGEMRFGYRWAFNVTGGVYSSRMYLKQANAAAQRLLERYLEPLNALAVLRGGPSQRALLAQGWRYVLQNHPHDSICGCSIDPVHREMTTRFEKLEGLGRGVEDFAWMHLAHDAEGQSGDDRRLTLFNPSPFVRDEVVTCDVSFFRQRVVVGLNPDVVPDPPEPPVPGFVLEDAEGREVPYEVVERRDDHAIAYNRYDYPAQSRVERFTLRVPLEALPPLGLRTLRVRRTDAFPSYPAPEGLRCEGRVIENAFVRVEARADGTFTVTDRATGRTYGPLGYFEDGADAGDEYNYSPPPQDAVLTSPGAAEIDVETVPGRYVAGLRVRGTWRLPVALTGDLQRRSAETLPLRFATTATLTPYSRHVTFETEVDNTVRDHRLRVLFETGCRTSRHHADNAFAVVSRTQEQHDPADFKIEVPAAVAPMHRFVTVEDDEAGATLLADGLPEYELQYDSGGVLALTLLRCVGELSRGNLAMRPGGYGGWLNHTPEAQCPGTHRFRYAFLPHGAGWTGHVGAIHRASASLLLAVRCRPSRRAELLPDHSFVAVEPAVLVLSAFKEAEDGRGFVLRIYNPTPEPVEGRVRLGWPAGEVRRANLEEVPLEAVAVQDGAFEETWPPFRIHTYRVPAR